MTGVVAQANQRAQMEAEAFDHLVYVRSIEACNLHCRHCFIPNNPKRLRFADLDALVVAVRRFAAPGEVILLQWHGGEPTLVGADWLGEAIARVERAAPEFRWRHGIQTNLMTYSAEWAALYREKFDGIVGVSWDYRIRQMRPGRPESNEAYEARFWPALDRLIADGLTPYLVVTGTRPFFECYRDPTELFEALHQRGVRFAHIERLTKTGYAISNWAELGLSNAEYSAHMGRFARAYHAWLRAQDLQGADRLNLSPFDGLLRAIERLHAGGEGGYGCWSGRCDSRFHTFDAAGYSRGCTAVTSGGSTEFGSGRQVTVQLLRAARQERRSPCLECRFRPVCSSGCLEVPFDDASGECSGGRRLFEALERLASIEFEKKEKAYG